MGKKKNRSEEEENEGMVRIALESLVSAEKLNAFMERYEPTDSECLAQKTFGDEKLRTFFGAYPVPGIGDPMSIYLSELSSNGYRMHVSASGEPVVFVRFRDEGPVFSLTEG